MTKDGKFSWYGTRPWDDYASATVVAGYLKSDLKNIKPTIMRGTTKAFAIDQSALADDIVRLAGVAKSGGFLQLEAEAKTVEDPFLAMGVAAVADGQSSEEMRELLEAEIDAMEARHRLGAKFFGDMGGYAPTLGIIGTVMGLVHVLGNLSSPGSLGPAIASAFIATLWGVLSANLIWLPISNKLKRTGELESNARHMVLEGMLAIAAGGSSRLVRSRVEAFLGPTERTPRAKSPAG
jgi:chemotaxis protein MotA